MGSGQDKDKAGAAPAESASAPASRSFLRRPKADAFVAPAHGFIPVFVILVLFLLAAIFVKSLFFGILAAVLSFHFEQLLERRFFATRPVRAFYAFCLKLNAPFTAFRKRIMRKIDDAPKPAAATEGSDAPADPPADNSLPLAERRRIAEHASAMTVILALIATVLVFWGMAHFIRPFAAKSGETMSNWARNNHVIERLEQKIDKLLDQIDPPSPEAEASASPATPENATPSPEEKDLAENRDRLPNEGKDLAENTAPTSPEEQAGPTRNVRERLRNQCASVLEEHNADLAKFTLRAGNEIVKNLFHITAWVGTFAFDLVMFLFFYYYFLLKMAVFAAGRENAGQRLGEWTVSSIYQSGWLPDASENEREGAARIIEHIYGMFRAWLVGYFWIIVLETVLYALIFIPFHVPFWPILALIAGSTILLPFLGPVLAALLSVVVTILFAQGGIVMPVIGIAVAYLVIHVILEQLLLYPMLVGEAIGLTLVETIIVVLLGAVVAGVSGMILAVPAAALLKLLVPLFYETMNKRRRLRRMAQKKDSGA